MENSSRSDLIVSGTASAAGGMFNKVTISGEGEINGDLDCFDFKVNGSVMVRGNLKAPIFKVSGQAMIDGDLKLEEVKVIGFLKSGDHASAKKFIVDGYADIKKDLSVEEVRVRGNLKIRGNCEAEIFTCRGTISIGGMLNAGNIDINPYGHSQIREIGGEKITIKEPGALGIGPGCEIELVEYKNDFQQVSKATVKENKKI